MLFQDLEKNKPPEKKDTVEAEQMLEFKIHISIRHTGYNNTKKQLPTHIEKINKQRQGQQKQQEAKIHLFQDAMPYNRPKSSQSLLDS